MSQFHSSKFVLISAVLFLFLQSCSGGYQFTSGQQNIAAVPSFNGDSPTTLPTSSGESTGHGPVMSLPPGSDSPAPAQISSICQFSGIDKINWAAPLSNSAQLQNFNVVGQSGNVDISVADNVNMTGNSGKIFVVENAQSMSAFTGNSGNFIGNVRSFTSSSGNSGSMDLNSLEVGNISGSSSGHLCVWAHSIESVTGSSAGNISLKASSSTGSDASLGHVSGSSTGILVITDMNVMSINGGSGKMYLQGGHVQSISGQSGDIYIDGLTVDQITGSSGTIYLLNGGQVLN